MQESTNNPNDTARAYRDRRAKHPGLRILRNVILILVLAYGGFAALLYQFQERYVFFPAEYMSETPDNIGLSYHDVRFKAEDGTVLHGWFVPNPNAYFTVLIMHGNAGNISYRLDTLRLFNEVGLSSFIFDYRGYGKSLGKPTEEGTYQDAAAAWQYLTKVRGIPASRIILFGRSLGGAVAAQLGTQTEPAGVILESTFTSIADMASDLYPYMPTRLLTRIHYDTERRIRRLNAPLLLIHSRDDRLIPFKHAQRLYDLAPRPKTLLAIHGSHNHGFLRSGAKYLDGLKRFIDDLHAKNPPSPLHEGNSLPDVAPDAVESTNVL